MEHHNNNQVSVKFIYEMRTFFANYIIDLCHFSNISGGNTPSGSYGTPQQGGFGKTNSFLLLCIVYSIKISDDLQILQEQLHPVAMVLHNNHQLDLVIIYLIFLNEK